MQKKKRCARYPAGTVVKPSDPAVRKEILLKYGGSYPSIRNGKYRYPAQSDREAWHRLYAAMMTYRNKVSYCLRNGYEVPPHRLKYKFEYVRYQGTKKQIKDRSIRVRDRRESGLKKGDKRVVHHVNPRNLEGSRKIKMTACEHHKIHGRRCKKKTK